MKVEQYQSVMLKDGRRAVIVEKFSEDFFLADVGDSPETWETIEVDIKDIDYVIKAGE